MKRVFTLYSLFYTALLAFLMVRSGSPTLSSLIHDQRHRSILLAGILILILLFCLLVGGLNPYSIVLSLATLTIFMFDGNSSVHYIGVCLYGILTAYSVAARWGMSVIIWILILPLIAMRHIGWAEVLYLLWLSILLGEDPLSN